MKETFTTGFGGIEFRANYFRADIRNDSGTVLFCLPGGGVTADLFNLTTNHSFVRLMTSKGHHIITMDHPGTGTNPLPNDHSFLKPRQSADYLAKCLNRFLEAPIFAKRDVIGIGHSMGGMMITLMQARHTLFQAIGLLGSSAGGLDWGLSEEERKYIDRQDDFTRDIEKLTLAKFGADFIEYPNQGPSGKSITFGGETPELTQRLRDITTTLYAAGGMMSMTRGSFRTEVNAINVPMFFAFGDHDIGIPPEDVPKDYMNAPSTELIVLENTGHNSVAFSSIETLCDRLDEWVSGLD